MDEGNAGKDLALEEKIKMAVKDEKGNIIENPMVEIGGQNIQLNILKDEEKENSYKIHILGVHILTLENDELSFNEGWEPELRERLEGIIDAEDLINELKEMEARLELEKEQQEENQKGQDGIQEDEKDEEDLSKKKEQEDPEKEKTIDEEKEQISKRYGVSPNQVVHISLNERSKRVTDKDTMAGLTKWGEKYNDVYTLPGEDEYSWTTIGIDKDGNEEQIEMRQLEGKDPDVTIKIQDENSPNKAIKEVRPLAIYEIDNETSYAIIRDSSGKTQALYCRQEEGRGKEYWGEVIPEAEGKNVREASVESREAISHEHNSNYDLAKKGKAYEDAKSLEERGFPSKEGKGVQMKEIEGAPDQNRQLNKEAIINDLADRAIAASPMPINKKIYMEIHEKELNAKAEKILSLGENDSTITYEEAINREAEQSKDGKDKDDEGEKLPGPKKGIF